MRSYLRQLETVLGEGVRRMDRTGIGTLSCFGLQARYDLTEGFPAVTTKKLAFKTLASELLWFISGSDNINDLKAILPGNSIWDGNCEDYAGRLGLDPKDGAMGRIYGTQWRSWSSPKGALDQLSAAVQQLRENPASRRHLVTAWNPAECGPDDVALPPCHVLFQFFAAEGRLSLLMYQRSADMFLGVPFNIASYALLLQLVAKVTGYKAHELIHSIGDAHIYLNHLDQVREQLSREPLPLPELAIRERGQRSLDDFVLDDFSLINYRSAPAIKGRMAV